MTLAAAEEFHPPSRFSLERRLGSGGFGVVFQAFDRERGSVVALKTLRRAGADALYRFKQEFRALADLAHPNLVALYELVSDADDWFFTMELVRGKDFLDYVRSGLGPTLPQNVGDRSSESLGGRTETDSRRLTVSLEAEELAQMSAEASAPAGKRIPPRWDRLRPALKQVADGLCALHAAGKLHRDIKPSNVLVTPEGLVQILDFGLVTEFGDSELLSADAIPIAGTPSYMAPEQARGRPASSAADWYSVGALLYEALTGRLPFSGHFLEIMALKQREEPPAPSQLYADIPPDLDVLCRDLLRREPDARPTGAEVLRRLSGGPSRGSKDTVPASLQSSTPLLGRKTHLARLEEALAATLGGRAVAVRIHGRSGTGKTALLQEFFVRTRDREPSSVVLAGRCYQQESVPYKAVDSLMDRLSSYLKALAPAETEALMPRDSLALARLFPVLLQVRAVVQSRRKVLEIPDSRELRRRAFAALRELLARLADRRPLILAIDDLQWGDLDSAMLLRELLREPDPPGLLLIACYRTEDAETSPILRALSARQDGGAFSGDVREIAVEELGPDESLELARAILLERGASPALAIEIARESGGNPFFLHELGRSVPVAAASVGDTNRPARRAGNLDDLILERVGRLPPEARRLLEIVSVAGRPLERAVAKAAADLADKEQPAVGILRAWRLLRAPGTSEPEQIETYHDRIRETVVADLRAGELQERHQSLAEAMEASGRADPERLAVHYGEAGELERSAHYAIEGADRAAAALAFDRAARLYRLALERLPVDGGSQARRDALQVKLGDALSNAGRGAEAARAYLEAAGGASSAERLELQRRAAEQLLRSGHVDEGLAAIRTVLDAVGMKLAKTPRRALAKLLAARARIRLRGLRFRERDASEVPLADLMRIDTCWSVAIGLGFVDTQRGAAFQSAGLLLALKAGEPYRVARALAVEAAYSSIAGGRSRERTRTLSDAAMRIARRLNNSHAIGLATVTSGIAAYFEGRWKDCRELLERGENLLREECTGVAFELDNAVYCTLFSLSFLGEVRELCKRLPSFLKDADDRGDLYSATNLRVRVSYLAQLAGGHTDQARRELSDAIEHWSRRGFHNQHWWNFLGRAQIELYAGQGADAWRIVTEDWPALNRSFVLRIQLIWLLSRYLRARCALAAIASGVGSLEQLLKAAESDANGIDSQKMSWAAPLALLVRGGIASARGDAARAVELLLHAEGKAEAASMQLHAAAARRSRGLIVGGSEGRALVESADSWMKDQKIVAPDRMAFMLAPGSWSPR